MWPYLLADPSFTVVARLISRLAAVLKGSAGGALQKKQEWKSDAWTDNCCETTLIRSRTVPIDGRKRQSDDLESSRRRSGRPFFEGACCDIRLLAG